MTCRKVEKSQKYTFCHGFSLIELLVAVAIFAAMAGMAWGGLNSIVRTRADLAHEEEDFRSLVRIVNSLDRDLRQVVVRSVRGNYGESVPAFLGAADHIEFTRMGLANPQAELRSNLQRVFYEMNGDKLYRAIYPELDRAPTTQPQKNLLRDRISLFRLRYLDAQQRWQGSWPEPNGSAAAGTDAALPRAVEIRVDAPGYGEITHIVELVADWPIAQ